MANENTGASPQNPGRIRIAWLDFTKACKLLLIPQIDDRPLDQYLQFRDSVMELVTSEEFLLYLENNWFNNNQENYDEKVRNTLLLELKAFAPAVEVATTTAAAHEKKPWWRSLLGRASTTVESIKDIVDDSKTLLKGGLTLLKELLDIFKK